MKNIELYIHIPFCVQKCKYCDFLSAPSTAVERQDYVDSLCERIKLYSGLAEAYTVSSIFFGGGTPSILEAQQTEKIMDAIRKHFTVDGNAEITTEMNPESVTREKLQKYKEIGINRLSIGLQSTNDQELRTLGRIHDYEKFLSCYEMAREEGFENINIDLMSAIPGQTLESYEEGLNKIIDLDPEHISAYSLIIEEGTPFFEMYGEGRGEQELPGEDTERKMYVRTKEILSQAGYERYEISNYSKPGYECRHNLGYWERVPYLGIGVGAASLFEGKRWNEPENIVGESSLNSREEIVELTRKEEIEEYLFLGLRKTKGISRSLFKQNFGVDVDEYYKKVIKKLVTENLLVDDGENIFLTEYGLDISNYVMSQFLL